MLVLVARQRAVLGEDLVTLIAREDFMTQARPEVQGEGEGVLQRKRKLDRKEQRLLRFWGTAHC